jgi:hypothetical protein
MARIVPFGCRLSLGHDLFDELDTEGPCVELELLADARVTL